MTPDAFDRYARSLRTIVENILPEGPKDGKAVYALLIVEPDSVSLFSNAGDEPQLLAQHLRFGAVKLEGGGGIESATQPGPALLRLFRAVEQYEHRPPGVERQITRAEELEAAMDQARATLLTLGINPEDDEGNGGDNGGRNPDDNGSGTASGSGTDGGVGSVGVSNGSPGGAIRPECPGNPGNAGTGPIPADGGYHPGQHAARNRAPAERL